MSKDSNFLIENPDTIFFFRMGEMEEILQTLIDFKIYEILKRIYRSD